MNLILKIRSLDKITLLSVGILLIFLIASLFPNLLANYDPNELHPNDAFQPPSTKYFLGTDDLGRDIWSRVIYGSQIAILISVSAMLISIIIGVPLGLLAGMKKGIVDGLV